jgi:cell division protein FtsW
MAGDSTTKAHSIRRLGSVNQLEKHLIRATAVLVGIGVVMVTSASAPQQTRSISLWMFFLKQAVFLLFGFVGFVIASRVSKAHLTRLARLAMTVSLILLLLVANYGQSSYGAKRWLGKGIFRFQPSEIFKLSLCIFVGVVVARSERRTSQWRGVAWQLLPISLGVGLIVLERDIGTNAVVLSIVLGMLFVAGLPRTAIYWSLGLGVLGFLGYLGTHAYAYGRLVGFLSPHANPDYYYQISQSKISLGAGGLFGLGMNGDHGKWGFLPNAHTDFIFSVIGEEYGLLGTVVVLLLFVWLIRTGIQVAQASTDRANSLIAFGITTWFAVEMIINVCSVVQWLPVTGIPLPFISGGGTALIVDLTGVGFLVNIAREIGSFDSNQSDTPPTRPRQAARTSTRSRQSPLAVARERRSRA